MKRATARRGKPRTAAAPAPAPASAPAPRASPRSRARAALAVLEGLGSKRNREGMARYGIVTDRILGVPMAQIQALGKELGKDHDLAAALWHTGVYEARLLCAYVEDPRLVTPAQMDRWAADFDNWAVCDTLCFSLFDRTRHAFGRVDAWARREEEFVKRAAFALLASLGLHDRTSADAVFLARLPLCERAATDGRNFVKKAVSWALRSVGGRTPARHAACVALARRLAASPDPAPRWVGKDVLRDLLRPLVSERLARAVARGPGGPGGAGG